jgi:hypothetical protein
MLVQHVTTCFQDFNTFTAALKFSLSQILFYFNLLTRVVSFISFFFNHLLSTLILNFHK